MKKLILNQKYILKASIYIVLALFCVQGLASPRDERPLCQFDRSQLLTKEERTKTMENAFRKIDKLIDEYAVAHKEKKLEKKIVDFQGELKNSIREICQAGWEISDQFAEKSQKITDFLKQGAELETWDNGMCNSFSELSKIEDDSNKASAKYLNVVSTKFKSIKGKYKAYGLSALPLLDQYANTNKSDVQGIQTLDKEFIAFWGAGPRVKPNIKTQSAYEFFSDKNFIENKKNLTAESVFTRQLLKIQREQGIAKARITVLSGHISDLKKQQSKCASLPPPAAEATTGQQDEKKEIIYQEPDPYNGGKEVIVTGGDNQGTEDTVDSTTDEDTPSPTAGGEEQPQFEEDNPSGGSFEDDNFDDGTNTSFLARNKNWLLLGAGAAVIGGGGYYLYKKGKKKDKKFNDEVNAYINSNGTSTSSGTSTSTSTSTETTGEASVTRIVAHPTSVISGQKSPTIVVEIHDSNGNKVDISGKVVTISCSENNCSLGGITSVESSNGTAQFNDVIFSSDVGDVTLSAQSEYGSDTSTQKIHVGDSASRE